MRTTAKIAYCKRLYGIVFSKDEIIELGDDASLVAKFIRDNNRIADKYKTFVIKHGEK